MAIMIWKHKPSLEITSYFPNKSMGDFLGIEFIEIGDDFITAKMPVNERTHQPFGLLHGGATRSSFSSMRPSQSLSLPSHASGVGPDCHWHDGQHTAIGILGEDVIGKARVADIHAADRFRFAEGGGGILVIVH